MTAPAPTGAALQAPSSTPTPTLFAGQLVAYAVHVFTPAEIAAVDSALPGRVLPVYGGEVAVDTGRSPDPLVLSETITVDPAAYAAALGVPQIAGELSSGVVLSQSEATLRGAAVGDTIHFSGGRSATVSAVVDDHWIGGYEMATTESVLGKQANTGPAYLLIADRGDEAGTAAAVHAALPDLTMRVRARTANGYVSRIDDTITQAQEKLALGEFAERRVSSGTYAPDVAWQSAHLSTESIPIIGQVTCNKAVLPDLIAAMQQVQAEGLQSLIHLADTRRAGGCYSSRPQPLGPGSLSRHVWGGAVDINPSSNVLGTTPNQDPRLVAIMEAHHFVWGGRWLRPDGMHFEWVDNTVDHSLLPPTPADWPKTSAGQSS